MEGFFMPNAWDLSPDDNYLFVDLWSHPRRRRGSELTDAQLVGGWKIELGTGSAAPRDQRAVRPITRRQCLLGASATLISTPAIVRSKRLMPVRGIIYPVERHYFGFIERQYVHVFLARITKLQNVGLSAHGIAAEFNERGISTGMHRSPWDAEHVMFVVGKNEVIRREDAIRRAEATFKSA
jgi:hypothetical protein